MRNFKYYLPGSILILIAILIVAFPEILVAFIAALVIMTGIGALYIGSAIRKSETEFRNMNGWFFDNEPFARRFVWTPKFRNFYR
jgi:hypothetical protein